MKPERIAAVAAGHRGVVTLIEVGDAVARLDADQHLRLIEPGHAGGLPKAVAALSAAAARPAEAVPRSGVAIS